MYILPSFLPSIFWISPHTVKKEKNPIGTEEGL